MSVGQRLRGGIVIGERRVETDQDDEVEVRACPTVTPPAAFHRADEPTRMLVFDGPLSAEQAGVVRSIYALMGSLPEAARQVVAKDMAVTYADMQLVDGGAYSNDDVPWKKVAENLTKELTMERNWRMRLQEELWALDPSKDPRSETPTTSRVASHGGDSPQRGIGEQGAGRDLPLQHIDGQDDRPGA